MATTNNSQNVYQLNFGYNTIQIQNAAPNGNQRADTNETRIKMEEFWKEHSKKATEFEMMLDTEADRLGKEEIPEVLSLLPDFNGKVVLELGSGIGRFTGKLASEVKQMVAVDFMESFIKTNEKNNGHLGNITFMQADVTQLNFPEKSFDIVFSNWLLMYLEEDELCNLFGKIFNWLRPGGYFFFRESCFHQSGNASRGSNPTKYRKPSMYNDILASLPSSSSPPTTNGSSSSPPTTNGSSSSPPTTNGSSSSPPTTNGSSSSPPTTNGSSSSPPTTNGSSSLPPTTNGLSSSPRKKTTTTVVKHDVDAATTTTNSFHAEADSIAPYDVELIMSKSVQTYIKMKSNRNQICWLVRKHWSNSNETPINEGCRLFNSHLNKTFTKVDLLLDAEKCFGNGNVSSGDFEVFQFLKSYVTLKENDEVLLVNCGLSGIAFHVAQEYKVNVLSVDSLANAVSLSLERANQLQEKKVQFEVGRLAQMKLLDGRYQLIVSLVPMMFQQAVEFFGQVQKCLKKGGHFLFVAYCSTYVNDVSKQQYKELLAKSSLTTLHDIDVTNIKLEALKRDLQNINKIESVAHQQLMMESVKEEVQALERVECSLVAFVCVKH